MSNQEFPKAVYHPKDGKNYRIVHTPEEEASLKEEWGISDAPKLSVGAGRKAKAE